MYEWLYERSREPRDTPRVNFVESGCTCRKCSVSPSQSAASSLGATPTDFDQSQNFSEALCTCPKCRDPEAVP